MSDLADVQIDEKIKRIVKEPKKYKVIFLNDNSTPIEWVIKVLTDIFKHSAESAERITLTVHNEGAGIAGVYSYEIAEQKTHETIAASRNHGFPLQIRMEEE